MNQKHIHERLLPITHAVHHLKKSMIERSIDLNYEKFSIRVRYDDYEASIAVNSAFQEIKNNDLINISIRMDAPDNLGTQILLNPETSRFRLILRNQNRFQVRVRIHDSTGFDEGRSFPLRASDEELFQLSTVHPIPEPEEIQEIRDIIGMYEFIGDDHLRIAYSDVATIHDNEFIEKVIGIIWRAVNV